MEARLVKNRTALEVICADKHVIRHGVKWLRFHCRCEECIPPFSAVRTIDKKAFDHDIKITRAEILDSVLTVEIDGEAVVDHVTTIPIDWLRANCNCTQCLQKEFKRREIKFSDPKVTPIPRKPYSSSLTSEEKFEILQNVFDVGFCILENVPTAEDTLLEVGKQFGGIRGTTYGEVFNVVSVPDPENAAYTMLQLPFHQDQTYYEASPGVQLLHALAFDETIKGGQSQLVDLFYAAEILRRESQEDFDSLCQIPASFSMFDRKREKPVWYQSIRTHLELDHFGNLVSINWHETLEGILRVSEEEEEAYYKAHKHFLEILNRPDMEFLFRMKAGDLTLFNNRRMAHARKQFDAQEGTRYLQGTYVDLDDMKSLYMSLADELGKKINPPKCGNRSWS